MTNSVSVEQCDREAAVRIMADRWHGGNQADVLEGSADHWIPVQECARHRIEALRQSSEREEKLRGVIVQMGENAAEAAKEYAVNMEKLREAIKAALCCTPSILYADDFEETGDASIIYDCGDPWAILRAALEATNG